MSTQTTLSELSGHEGTGDTSHRRAMAVRGIGQVTIQQVSMEFSSDRTGEEKWPRLRVAEMPALAS